MSGYYGPRLRYLYGATTAPTLCAACGAWPAPGYSPADRRVRLCAACERAEREATP